MSVSNIAGDHYTGTRSMDVGEIIAFRAWKVIEGGPIPLLKSFSMPYIWRSGVNNCTDYSGGWWPNRPHLNPDKGERPTPKNYAGFYALKDYTEILDYWGVSTDWYCLGAVELWGEVICGTKGYRAEYASIQNIVSLVRSTRRTPRIINSTGAWRRAIREAFLAQPYVTFDEEAGKLDRQFDNHGPLISELRRVYLKE